MSELFDLISKRLDPDMLGAIAGRLGLGGDDAKAATATSLPALLGGMAHRSQSVEGAHGLLNDIEATDGGSSLDGLLDRLRGTETEADTANENHFGGMLGGGMLDALVGKLGIGGPTVKKLLGVLGPLVIGALGKIAGSGGLSRHRLTSLLGDATGAAADVAPGGRASLASILGPIAGALGLGGAGLAAAKAQSPDPSGNVVDTVAEREAVSAPAAAAATGGPQEPNRRAGLAWIALPLLLAALLIAALASRGCGDDDTKATTTSGTAATTTTTTATPTTPTAGITVASDADGKITLTGAVPDEAARTAAVDSATAAFGDGNVTDQLTVDANATAGPAGDLIGTVLAALKGAGTGWSAAFDSADAMTLTGEVASEDVKSAVVKAATDAFAPGTVTDKMTVAAGGTSTDAQEAVDEINKEISLRGVTFVTGSANLTGASRTTLDRVVKVLSENAAVNAEVQGHTDNQGNAAANLALSTARAKAVVAYLVGKGIAADRLTAKGYGQTKPVASNATPAGRAKNRRVVFVPKG